MPVKQESTLDAIVRMRIRSLRKARGWSLDNLAERADISPSRLSRIERRPVPEIAGKLTIKTGKNAGKHPSVASLHRALAEADEAVTSDDAQIIGPRHPVRTRITGPAAALTRNVAQRELTECRTKSRSRAPGVDGHHDRCLSGTTVGVTSHITQSHVPWNTFASMCLQ